MKRLAKSGVSKAALFGILFFAVGCGSKEEEPPPNYVVREVQTGTMTEDPQEATQPPADGDKKPVSAGNSSIIREEVGEMAGKGNGADTDNESMDGGRKEPSGIGSVKAPSGAEGGEPSETEPAPTPPDAGEEESSGANSVIEPTPDGEEEPPETDMDGDLPDGDAAELSGIAPDQVLPETGGKPADMASGEPADGMPVDEMDLLPAETVIDVGAFPAEKLSACFYFKEVPDTVFGRMEGNSYPEDCTVALSQLRYVRVLHYGFDGEVHIGELVVNQAIAQDICDIFKELFDARYPIEKMVLIDTYGGDDDASMADNNTSSFNFRVVEGTTSLSKHAYGLAVDVNPLYNPYIPVQDGVSVVRPENAEEYVDRDAACEYYIRHGDLCYEAFISRGFTWGGDWAAGKDYQHFSKTIE